MKPEVIYATHEHFPKLKEKDQHIDATVLEKKLSDQQIIIAQSDSEISGFLRFGFFWDEIPFMNLLLVEASHRKKGIGKQLVQFWESEMKKKKHKFVMTSSLSNENAQHFFRKLGYIDTGSLLLPKEALEIIFMKELP